MSDLFLCEHFCDINTCVLIWYTAVIWHPYILSRERHDGYIGPFKNTVNVSQPNTNLHILLAQSLQVIASWHGNIFPIPGLSWGEPPVTSGFTSQKASDTDLYSFLCNKICQAVEQTIKLGVAKKLFPKRCSFVHLFVLGQSVHNIKFSLSVGVGYEILCCHLYACCYTRFIRSCKS